MKKRNRKAAREKENNKNDSKFPVYSVMISVLLTLSTGSIIAYGVKTHGHTHVPMMWIYFFVATVLWALFEIGLWWRR